MSKNPKTKGKTQLETQTYQNNKEQKREKKTMRATLLWRDHGRLCWLDFVSLTILSCWLSRSTVLSLYTHLARVPPTTKYMYWTVQVYNCRPTVQNLFTMDFLWYFYFFLSLYCADESDATRAAHNTHTSPQEPPIPKVRPSFCIVSDGHILSIANSEYRWLNNLFECMYVWKSICLSILLLGNR